MARWTLIFWAVFVLQLTQVREYSDGSVYFPYPLPGRMDRLVTSIDRPLSYQLTEIDDNGPPKDQAPVADPEVENLAPPPQKKPQPGNGRRDRQVPLKPARPSEEIKADQVVDFPYDI